MAPIVWIEAERRQGLFKSVYHVAIEFCSAMLDGVDDICTGIAVYTSGCKGDWGVCCIVPECPIHLEGIRALISIAKTRLCGAEVNSVSRSLRNSELSGSSSASQAAGHPGSSARDDLLAESSPGLAARQRSALRETCAAKSFLSSVVQPHSPPNSCSRVSSPCLHCSLRPVPSCHLSAHRNEAFWL